MNTRATKFLDIEHPMLKPLPVRHTAEFEEMPARVSKYTIFTLKGMQYSAPSQLIGHRLMVRQHAQHIECWLGGQCVLSRPRAKPQEGNRRGRSIDHRHLVGALKRKPGAFARWVLRDAAFPACGVPLEDTSESEVVISQGFTPLKHCAFTAEGDILPLHQAPNEKGKIAQYVYGGFSKCAYPVQKFHSDTERVLACVLERDALLWFRPVAGQFSIYYRSGANQPEYVPDFVAATADHNLIIETKAAKDMAADDVKVKADAAAMWCKNSSEYSQAQCGKPWKHLLVPHDAVAHNATVSALAGRYLVASS